MMTGRGCALFVVLTGWLWASLSPAGLAQDSVEVREHVALLTFRGAIGPATTDYLVRAMRESEEGGARLIVIKIDTPGGLDAASRDIIQAIIASRIPVVTYVYPQGSRAASAGTYILYASHIAAMSPSTTLGAATPVSMGPPSLPNRTREESAKDDETEQDEGAEDTIPPPETAMERKVLNDAVAFIRGLATRHGRNAEWAEKAVIEAATLTAEEALEQQVVDVVAEDLDDLLVQIDGREVRMEDGTQTIAVEGLPVIAYDPDWRSELLAIITNPQVAYILLMIGIYGLILEGYNPGALVPGVIGAICLLIAFYALQVLPVNYAGLALIILGVLLIVAETLAPSFGILGIGGVIATVMGSLMLIDTDVPGMEVSLKLIGGIAAASSLLVLAVLFAVGRSLRIKRTPVEQALVGETATVESFEKGRGSVHVVGERWQALSNAELRPGQHVRVTEQHGLILNVEPLEGEHHA